MATIRKRDSKWHVQVRRSGQSQTRSFTHKADAEAWGRKTERDIDTDDLSNSDRLSRIFLRELLERYSSEVLPKKRSGVIEQFFVDRFLRHRIAALPLSRLSSTHISQYRDERLQMVSGSTVHRELGVLRHVFEVARKDWGIPLKSNPVHGITMPSVGRPRERRVPAARRRRCRRVGEACARRAQAPVTDPALICVFPLMPAEGSLCYVGNRQVGVQFLRQHPRGQAGPWAETQHQKPVHRDDATVPAGRCCRDLRSCEQFFPAAQKAEGAAGDEDNVRPAGDDRFGRNRLVLCETGSCVHATGKTDNRIGRGFVPARKR